MRFCCPVNKTHSMFPSRSITGGMVVLGVSLAVVSAPAAAANEFCPPDQITVPKAGPKPEKPGDPIPVELEGDEVESVKEDTVTMRGNASLKRGRQAMTGDEITYYRQTDEVEGKGNVVLYSANGDRLETSYLRFQVETFIGETEAVEYRLAKRDRVAEDPEQVYVNARGTAEKLFLEGHEFLRMENMRYTTCVEGQDDVYLTAREMTLDQATGQGVGKNVTVRFKDVPIFYFPQVSFPIDDRRKSGFLFPRFGSQEGSGFVLETPYYWNIADNYDATIYPRFYASRGVKLGTEFRYLTENAWGFVYGEYMPSDDEFEDGGDRGAFTYRHDHELSRRWDANVNLEWVSDDSYFDDFSNDIQVSSAIYLPQVAELNYTGDYWDFEAVAFAYQTVDDTIPDFAEPYDRLPSFRVYSKLPRGPFGLRYGVESELVNFDHDRLVNGWRWDITPEIRLPLEEVWGFVTPELEIRHTSYSLDDAPEGQESSPSRTVPIFSVDSGIYFERETSWRGGPFLQTLEPRLFYVYVPKENQDDLPVFDTGFVNLNNFGNIFSKNRFFGRDRVGDTSQVTLALTSRYIDLDSGREWIRGSIGQVYFFEDREVNLSPGQVFTDDTSDFLAEVVAEFTERWSTYGYLQYDDDGSEVREAKLDLRYRAAPRKYLEAGYRFSRDLLEQVSLQAEWPLGSPRWHVSLEEHYSVRDDENLETRIGLEYDACCWKVRSFFQRRKDITSEFRNAFILELELTGLARIRSGL